MTISADDRIWLEGLFAEVRETIDAKIAVVNQGIATVHDRITAAEKEQLQAVAALERDLATHKATPCQDVARHVVEYHDWVKILGVIATLATIAGTVGGIIVLFNGRS